MAKSIEVRFNEALAAVKKAGRMTKYEEASKTCTNIESKLNAAEAVLKDAGVVRAKESTSLAESAIARLTHEQYQVFSKRLGKNPKMCESDKIALAEAILRGEVKESTPIPKHNGAAENFVENNPLRSREEFSPGYVNTKPLIQKGDKVLFDGLLKLGKITEAEHRKMTGCKPEGYEQLSEQKRKDFDFARAVGLSESDAFKLVEMTGSTFKEVSRR